MQSLNMINLENGNDALADGRVPKCMDCKGLLTDVCHYREVSKKRLSKNETSEKSLPFYKV